MAAQAIWQAIPLLANPTALPRVTCRATPSGKDNRTASVGFGGKVKKEPLWQCVQGCGACCKFVKGPNFPSPEEVFDNPQDLQLYKSMTGPDGWCIHYEKSTRTCSIYNDRPYFCRVQPDIFEMLYGVKEKNFNKAACSACKEAIKSIHGASSKELQDFKQAIYG